MPIVGLTDQPRAFVELGQLRKGDKKTDPKKPGADLTYFRATFNEGEEKAAKRFFEEYGDKPQAIEIFLPFDEPEANLDAWKEAYLASGLVHRCNGEYVERAVDPDNGQVTVRDGKHVETGERVKCDGQPITHWTDEQGVRQPVYCKPHGRLKVIVPQLRRLAYMTVLTTSIWDIANLSKEMEGYRWENKGKLRGIRFILKRTPKLISTPSGKGGKKARRKKWLLHIEPAPSWVEEQFLMLEQAARPKLIEAPLELPPDMPDTNGDDDVEDEIAYEIQEGGQVWEDERPVYETEPAQAEMPKFANMNEFYQGVLERFGYPDKKAAADTLRNYLGMTVLETQKIGGTMQDLWNALLEIEKAKRQLLDGDPSVDYDGVPF